MNDWQTLKGAIQAQGYLKFKPGEMKNRAGKPMLWTFELRRVLMQPENLHCYLRLFWRHALSWRPFQVCGPEVSGVLLAMAIGADAKINTLFVRKARREGSVKRMLEGTHLDQPVVIVDDVMNSGRSIRRCVNAVQEAGLTVKGVIVVARTRRATEYKWLEDMGIKLIAFYRQHYAHKEFQ